MRAGIPTRTDALPAPATDGRTSRMVPVAKVPHGPPARPRAVLAARVLLALGVWLVLTGGAAGALLPGLLAAAAAAWLSLRLLPPMPRARPPRPLGLLRLVLRFLGQSVLGGVDVARRAFRRRMPLDPGLVECSLLHLPPGAARNAFLAEISLLPGTLAAGVRGDTLVLHCLDRAQPAAALLEAEQAGFAAAIGAAAPPAGARDG